MAPNTRGAALTLIALLAGVAGWAQGIFGQPNYEEALAAGKASESDLLVFVNGSDWSRAAKLFEQEVLASDDFAQAARNMVCLQIDHPNVQPEAQAELDKKNAGFKVEVYNYPTVALIDLEGRCFGLIVGYKTGGKADFLHELARLRHAKVQRDAEFALAQEAQGPQKALHLGKGLEFVPEPLVGQSYKGVLEQVKQADPGDTTGYYFRFTFDMCGFVEGEIWPRCDKKDFDAALQLVEDRLANDKLTTLQRQRLLAARYCVLGRQDKVEESYAVLRQIIDLDRDSDMGKGARGLLDYYHRPIATQGKWVNGMLHTRFVEWRMDVGEVIRKPGTYQVKFVRTDGDDLEVRDLVLTDGAKPLATGEQTEPLTFKLAVDSLPADGTLQIRMQVKGVGWWLGGYGDIVVTPL